MFPRAACYNTGCLMDLSGFELEADSSEPLWDAISDLLERRPALAPPLVPMAYSAFPQWARPSSELR